jgi:hypothetical protein
LNLNHYKSTRGLIVTIKFRKKIKKKKTLSVTMPESRPWASVSSTASTRLAAIRRHASDTAVASGIVSVLDSRSFLTVLSPLYNSNKKIQSFGRPVRGEAKNWKEGEQSLVLLYHEGYLGWLGEVGLEATFPLPFPLAAAAVGSSDLREEADGGRLRVRRLGGAAGPDDALMALFVARARLAAGEVGAGGLVAAASAPLSPDLLLGSLVITPFVL